MRSLLGLLSVKFNRYSTPMCPSGPTQLRLQSLAPKLAAKGIKLTAFMRDYDRLIWAHANKGFFQLGKQIPNFLAVMEVGHKQGAERSLIGL